MVFIPWEDPQRFGTGSVFSFLQQGLERHLSASTLNVRDPQRLVIAVNHDIVDGRSFESLT